MNERSRNRRAAARPPKIVLHEAAVQRSTPNAPAVNLASWPNQQTIGDVQLKSRGKGYRFRHGSVLLAPPQTRARMVLRAMAQPPDCAPATSRGWHTWSSVLSCDLPAHLGAWHFVSEYIKAFPESHRLVGEWASSPSRWLVLSSQVVPHAESTSFLTGRIVVAWSPIDTVTAARRLTRDSRPRRQCRSRRWLVFARDVPETTSVGAVIPSARPEYQQAVAVSQAIIGYTLLRLGVLFPEAPSLQGQDW